MMEKIRIVHHSNQLGLGGTEKTMQLFCKYLDKGIFDVHALTYKHPVSPHKVWLNSLKALIGSEKAMDWKARFAQNSSRVPEFKEILGPDHLHFYTLRTLQRILKKISPHILHVHHSGEIEPPLDQTDAMSGIPIIFTTNVFGVQGRSPEQERLSKILFVSNWLKDVASPWSKGDQRYGVLYNPVEKPFTYADLRSELGIPKETFVVGRIGRNADDIHDPISLRAYREIETDKTLFLALSPPPAMIRESKEMGIKNIHYLKPSTDDLFLSSFYNTIDVLAHARLDGETFGCVIAEAMIHGKPVVTHRSDIRNAQTELVDTSCGYVTDQHDYKAYASYLKSLMDNKDLRLKMGEAARRRALTNFEAGLVTKKLEALYLEELGKTGISVDNK